MRNIVLHLAFDGARYHGWQVQENAVSVQKTVQDAIERVFHTRLGLTGCSRTDAGVHANDYVCCFRTEATIPPISIARAINTKLPADIAVRDCHEVDAAFHPRYSALGKEYIYKICDAQFRDPFLRDYALYYWKKLDSTLLNEAATRFLGKHDFAAFCSAGSTTGHRPEEISDTVRTIYAAEVIRDGDLVQFRVHGDGFLYNMVRIMVGTLLFVAQGRLSPADIAAVITSGDRRRAGPTAPAHALYLNHVFYA